jgi:hypothetical protein
MVVEVNDLDCLDFLIWLRTGGNAAHKLNRTQATICRTTKRVCEAFDISLKKESGEWVIIGDDYFLNLERKVHQEYRWRKPVPLRIETQYFSGPLYLQPPPAGFIAGNFDFAEIRFPIAHLRAGVIDAWIGVYPDVPKQDDPDLASFHLTRLPLRLAVSKFHPLARMGNKVTLDDVRNYPCLALKDGAFPEVQKQLSGLGLWNTQTLHSRYDYSKWEGMTEDQATVGYATAFSEKVFEFPTVNLPIDLSLSVGDTIIVKRTYADHPRFTQLLKHLQSRARELSTEEKDVSLMF